MVSGFYNRRYLNPEGEDADLWEKLGEEFLQGRDPSCIVVLFVNSHLDGKAVYKGLFPEWLILANAAADAAADVAAQECRVSASERTRVNLVEKKAFQVRHRLLRATLDATEVEKRLLPVSEPEKKVLVLTPMPSHLSRPLAESQLLSFVQSTSCLIVVKDASGVRAPPRRMSFLNGDKVLASI